jgi:hypothetical protein
MAAFNWSHGNEEEGVIEQDIESERCGFATDLDIIPLNFISDMPRLLLF